jgi:hypothetical protein
MLAPLATIAFLFGLWLAIVAIARTIEHSGSSIMAALSGQSPLATAASVQIQMRVSNRASAHQQRPMRAKPTLRAAA